MAMLLSVHLLLAGFHTVRADEKSAFPEAVAQLKKEQSLAESYAGLLKEYGSTDLRTYARGIALYAEAKAEFDGLLEHMITALHQGKAPDTSEAFQRQLTKAVDRRVVFTSFMVDEILNKIPEGERSLAVVLRNPAGAVALLTTVTEAGKAIWAAYQQSTNQEREVILGQLQALRWKPFDEIKALK
jgi:hypothetical protein